MKISNQTRILIAFCFFYVATAWALNRVNYEAIWNSTIDNTPIGVSAGASGNFSTLSANSIFTQGFGVNSHASSYTGDVGGYVGFNYAGNGDMDFISTNGGATPLFNWYYLLGGSLVREMWLDSSATLNVPNGINANLNGNASSATTATTAGSATTATTATTTTGNAGTASSLATTPTNCGANHHAYGISANGNALCGTPNVIAQTVVLTSGICTTASGAGGTCTISGVTWPIAWSSTAYGVSCNPAPPSGSGSAPSINTYVGTKTTTNFAITLQGGQSSSAGSNTTSEIDCTGVGVVP